MVESELRRSPIRIFALMFALLFTLGVAACFSLAPKLSWLESLLIALNISTLIICGYDKMIAGSDALRVPESLFLILATLGGSVGMLVGMNIFRHKTRKPSFLVKLICIIALQMVAAKMFGV